MSQQSKPTSFLVLLVVLAVALLLVSSLLTPNTTQSLQYSDVLDLFRNEKVASFTLEGSNLTMQVRGDGDTTSTVTAKIGDTEQFRADLDDLIAEQYAAGTLKSYNYLPASDPWYRAATPYIIGGIVLLIVFFSSSRAAQTAGPTAWQTSRRPTPASAFRPPRPSRSRRSRCRRGKGGAGADRGLPARPQALQPPRRENPQGRAARRPSGNRQDAACKSRRWRSGRIVSLYLGLRLCRALCRRGREPRARFFEQAKR